MTGWRHVERFDDGRCAVDVEGLPCGCYPPTPDPASPCGQSFVFHGKTLMTCGKTRERHGAYPDSHVPTLCRCGHRIEEAR